LLQAPIETIAAGSSHGKRLLIGTNRDESALFIGPHPAQNHIEIAPQEAKLRLWNGLL
jgi:carboxylesterase type B